MGISSVLTLVFGGLVAVSTGALLFLSLENALESTRSDLGARLENLLGEAAEESEIYFQPLQTHAAWIAQKIIDGDLDPKNKDEFEDVVFGATSTLPQIAAVSYQYPDGTGLFYDAERSKLHEVIWPPEWRVRLNRREENPQVAPPSTGVWVLRPSVLDGLPNSTFIYPVRTPEGDLGVVAVRVNLELLSRSFAADATYREYELVRFILFDNNVVIGHPLLKDMGEIRRPTIDVIDDPFLKELESGNRFPLRIVGDIPGVETFALQTEEGQRVFALATDMSREAGGELMVGVHFDPRAGSTEFRRLISMAVTGGLLVLGSILVAFFLGRRAAAPMQRLADAALLVQENKLDEVKELPVGTVKELATAANAFNKMVEGLKERTKIRDLFGKYVPQNVATLLLSDDNTAQPQNAIATVLFLDLEKFSALSEKLEPADVVATMNAFFSDAVRIIEAEGGMVTQFQGDAILAVFNIPIPKDDHAAAAIRSGIAILDQLKVRDYAGHDLKCRIGINTGPLVAGAIGAEDRLSYTVYGDAVNVAARLEQMNKEFNTRILVSDETAKLAEIFEFKTIGECAIRGRQAPVEVLTLEN
ncbi:MAG: adenylate/guanylate cyclase domain-containing protein [Pseudomonadota bacterium]